MKILSSKNRVIREKSLSIDEHEIFSELAEKSGTSLFLGKYPLNAVLSVLRKRNFFKEAQKRKLWPLEFDLDSSEFPPSQRFRIFHKTKEPENMIVDLKIKESQYRLKEAFGYKIALPPFSFLTLDWLTLQNPLQQFSTEKTPLPGQTRPGLGLGKKVVDLFIYLARLNRNDGILAFPAYFHNALLFSRYFHFINPEKKAEVLTIRKTFPKIPFKELAWIVHLNCMKEKEGKTYEWNAEEQVYPLNKSLTKYFNSRQYKMRFNDAFMKKTFVIDWDCYEKKRGKKR